jgi:hypothetical protein
MTCKCDGLRSVHTAHDAIHSDYAAIVHGKRKNENGAD